jgi:peptidoglycan/LPS O-acetylase OafA/YrhL
MPTGALILALPLALGGESAGGEGTGIAVLSVVSIVAGYLLIAALWYFVFRDRARTRRRRRRGPSD